MRKSIETDIFLKILKSTNDKTTILSVVEKEVSDNSVIISFVNRGGNSNRFSYDCILGANVKEILNSLFIYGNLMPAGTLSFGKKKKIFQKQYTLSRLKIKQIFRETFRKGKVLFIFIKGEKENRIILILNKTKIKLLEPGFLEIVKDLFELNKLREVRKLHENDIKMYSAYIGDLEKKLHIINYLSNSLMATLRLEEIFKILSDFISMEIGFKSVLVNMISSDDKTLERVAAAGISDEIFEELQRKKIPVPNIRYLLKDKYKLSNYIYFIRNIRQTEAAEYSAVIDNKFSDFGEDRSRWHSEDTILIPIYDRTGKLIGTISLDNPVDGKIPGSKTLELLEIISKFATLAIRNAFLYKKTSDTTDKLAKAYEVTGFISKIMTVNDLVRNLTIMLRDNFDYLNVVILKKQNEKLKVFFASDYNDKEIDMINKILYKTNSSVTKRSWIDRRSYLIKDSRKVTDFITIRNNVVSEIAIPIIVHDESWGVLNVEKEGANSLGEQDLKLLEIIVHHLSSAIENANLYKELNRMANTDPMTGLYNYRYLKKHLADLMQGHFNYGKHFSLVMLDMNNFKGVNDTYGHIAGDEVLKWLGKRMIDVLEKFSKVKVRRR
ncbi:MAG: diguanylate cyclase [Proteobacteria bacterium]|nr:diguanylate cyclase [Pseudomonadota bacterium]